MTSQTDCQNVYALYGALRSGTTLLRLILQAHPAIHCDDETDFMVDYLAEKDGELRFRRVDLAADRIFRGTGMSVPDTRDGRAAFFDLLAQYRRDRSGPLVLVLHRSLGRLLHVLPGIRVIHLVRDPRDVARSSIGMGWAGNTWHGVSHWIRTETEWDRERPRLRREPLELRYEEVLTDPVPKLTELCQFLGVAYDPVMMNYPNSSTYSAIDPALSYQWKRKQSPREIAHVEHRVGNLLQARGYEPSGVEIPAPGMAERLHLALHNRAGIWKLRTERYGYFDPIVLGAARRLGVRPLARKMQRRIDDKTVKFLK